MTSRQQDEILLDAMRLIKTLPLKDVAKRVGKDPSNLRKAMNRVMVEDMLHDPEAVSYYRPMK